MRTVTATALRPSTAVLGLALLLAIVGATRVAHDLGDLEKPAVRKGWRSASVVAYGDINSVSGRGTPVKLHNVWEPLGLSIDGGVVVANGNYSDAALHPSFFGQLRLESFGGASDGVQGYAAGFLEGALTAVRISQHYGNMESWWSGQGSEVVANVTAWLKRQDAFANALVETASDEQGVDSVPARLRVVVRQLDGLADGYAQAVEGAESQPLRALRRTELHLLNSVGDMLDLFAKAKSPIPWASLSPSEVLTTVATAGHCSALIKVTPDLGDLLMAHSSWFIYGSMLRIYKHYTLNVAVGAMRSASFSSYPGVLSSLDDFYLHDTGIVLLQTTNSVFNSTLYEQVRPGSLLAWERVRIANMGASGAEWVDYVSAHNSGTYNNQYMVVDLKRFQPGRALLDGLLTVVEQIPGEADGIVSADMTQLLVLGYWPSFNVPFFDKVYRKSGYSQLVSTLSSLGPEYASAAEGLSYQAAPRSKIFRRDAGAVTDLASLKHLMRYNGFPDDPLSGGSPFGAICSRGDLAEKPAPVGCYDTKVTNYKMAWGLQAEAINGPTTEEGLPPFNWAPFRTMKHQGQPGVWNFDFELQSPKDVTENDESNLATMS